MIENFENVKRQLGELSEVINSFKSEAVQLKIIELVLGNTRLESIQEEKENSGDRSRVKKRRKTVRTASEASGAKTAQKKSRVAAGSGAIATLRSVYTKGFFKEARKIGDILEHCETNLARKIKANEISGTLARMVRNNELSRKKNKDGQYEYRNFQA